MSVRDIAAAPEVAFVDLKAQFHEIRGEVMPAIMEVLENTSYIMGPQLSEFERRFAAFAGARECIGVESGTAALKVALLALGIGRGDEVILPANTYIASALAVSEVGATPVFVDMDDFYLMDPNLVEGAITQRTRAIMPVHLYGQAVPMEPILGIAKRNGLKIIEDASQAHGARWNDRPVGSFGDVGCFSFYPGKNLGAYGDGGAIVTSNPQVADYARLYRDFGQRKKYEHSMKGDNCRLDTLQAAVLTVKLGHLEGWTIKRRWAAALYDEKLARIGIEVPRKRDEDAHVYHLYVIEVEDRERIQNSLKAQGVQTGIHYPIPIHLQAAYSDLNLGTGSFPRTEFAAGRVLSLPMFPEISESQVDHVVSALKRSLSGSN